jgi:preprotein translocase subunit SecA
MVNIVPSKYDCKCAVVAKRDHYNEIRSQIMEFRKSKCEGGVDRPVLVFFQTTSDVDAFVKQIGSPKLNCGLLTERLNGDEQRHMVRQAVSAGAITLTTKDFGRGTDFISLDPRVESSGGVHVIQTFVSDDVSEELQIRGRTARQGNSGSYSLAITYDEANKYGLTKSICDELTRTNAVYFALNNARASLSNMKEMGKKVESLEKTHRNGMQYLNSLAKGDWATAIELLKSKLRVTSTWSSWLKKS